MTILDAIAPSPSPRTDPTSGGQRRDGPDGTFSSVLSDAERLADSSRRARQTPHQSHDDGGRSSAGHEHAADVTRRPGDPHDVTRRPEDPQTADPRASAATIDSTGDAAAPAAGTAEITRTIDVEAGVTDPSAVHATAQVPGAIAAAGDSNGEARRMVVPYGVRVLEVDGVSPTDPRRASTDGAAAAIVQADATVDDRAAPSAITGGGAFVPTGGAAPTTPSVAAPTVADGSSTSPVAAPSGPITGSTNAPAASPAARGEHTDEQRSSSPTIPVGSSVGTVSRVATTTTGSDPTTTTPTAATSTTTPTTVNPSHRPGDPAAQVPAVPTAGRGAPIEIVLDRAALGEAAETGVAPSRRPSGGAPTTQHPTVAETIGDTSTSTRPGSSPDSGRPALGVQPDAGSSPTPAVVGGRQPSGDATAAAAARAAPTTGPAPTSEAANALPNQVTPATPVEDLQPGAPPRATTVHAVPEATVDDLVAPELRSPDAAPTRAADGAAATRQIDHTARTAEQVAWRELFDRIERQRTSIDGGLELEIATERFGTIRVEATEGRDGVHLSLRGDGSSHRELAELAAELRQQFGRNGGAFADVDVDDGTESSASGEPTEPTGPNAGGLQLDAEDRSVLVGVGDGALDLRL